MEFLSPKSIALLRAFAEAPEHSLSVDSLHQIMSNEDYEYRINQLSNMKLIEPAQFGPSYWSNGLLHTAPITAFRLTAQGLDNLSQFTQNSELRRIQTGKQHHRSKSKKRRIKAIVSAIAAIIGTLAALLEILNYIRH